MYRCDVCEKLMPPGTKCVRLALRKRKKAYPQRQKANRIDDPGGLGHESSREVNACPNCAREHPDVNPE